MARPTEIHSCHVCVNISCREGGSEELLRALTERLGSSNVQVKPQICFGACWMGPNIVLYPLGTWYSDVQASDLDEVVSHIQGGEPVARLMGGIDPGLHEMVLSLLEAGLD